MPTCFESSRASRSATKGRSLGDPFSAVMTVRMKRGGSGVLLSINSSAWAMTWRGKGQGGHVHHGVRRTLQVWVATEVW